MRILLDECLPRRLKQHLSSSAARTVPEMGWSGLKNGALLTLAEPQFDVFVTVDQNLEYQQALAGRSIAIIVLDVPNNRLATFIPLLPKVEAALQTIQPGELLHVG